MSHCINLTWDNAMQHNPIQHAWCVLISLFDTATNFVMTKNHKCQNQPLRVIHSLAEKNSVCLEVECGEWAKREMEKRDRLERTEMFKFGQFMVKGDTWMHKQNSWQWGRMSRNGGKEVDWDEECRFHWRKGEAVKDPRLTNRREFKVTRDRRMSDMDERKHQERWLSEGKRSLQKKWIKIRREQGGQWSRSCPHMAKPWPHDSHLDKDGSEVDGRGGEGGIQKEWNPWKNCHTWRQLEKRKGWGKQ